LEITGLAVTAILLARDNTSTMVRGDGVDPAASAAMPGKRNLTGKDSPLLS
jgi:hypothetical protein